MAFSLSIPFFFAPAVQLLLQARISLRIHFHLLSHAVQQLNHLEDGIPTSFHGPTWDSLSLIHEGHLARSRHTNCQEGNSGEHAARHGVCCVVFVDEV